MPTDVARPPIRIGLLVGATRGPAWWRDVIDALVQSPDALIVGAHVARRVDPRPRPRRGATVLRLYQLVDGRLFGRPDDPSRVVDLRSVLGDMAALSDESGTAAVDLILTLGAAPDAWRPVTDPQFGTWVFEHPTDPTALVAPVGGALPPGGEELLRGQPSATTLLVAVLGPTAGRWLLGEVISRVDILSLRRGSRGHLRKLPTLVVGAVQELREVGTLPGRPDPMAQSVRQAIGRPAQVVAMALLRTVVGYGIRRLRRALMTDRWVIGVIRSADPTCATGNLVRDVQVLETPPGLDWADPFPIRLPDLDILFIEEYDRRQDRGWLTLVELDDSPRGYRSVEIILDLPHHLSYPFVFEWEGSWYLMPEQASTGSLALYRARSFPREWRWHATALDLPVADPTLARIGERWWLFGAIKVDGGNAADELHLFHAESPLGPWTPHARNPVVSDIRTARPAGRIFQRNDRWFRPAQDGTLGYGHSMVILEILDITPETYRERPVGSILPDWAPGLIATHSINEDAGLTAIDGLLRESRLRKPRR